MPNKREAFSRSAGNEPAIVFPKGIQNNQSVKGLVLFDINFHLRR